LPRPCRWRFASNPRKEKGCEQIQKTNQQTNQREDGSEMNHLSFSDKEFELLKDWTIQAIADNKLGSDDYEDTLNSISEKILWNEET
jgi:hypothetical protein